MSTSDDFDLNEVMKSFDAFVDSHKQDIFSTTIASNNMNMQIGCIHGYQFSNLCPTCNPNQFPGVGTAPIVPTPIGPMPWPPNTPAFDNDFMKGVKIGQLEAKVKTLEEEIEELKKQIKDILSWKAQNE